MSNAPPIEEVVTRTDRYRRRRVAFDRWQRRFLILGAIIDIGMGGPLYFYSRQTIQLFHLVPVPEATAGAIWVQLVGLMLMTMAVIYLYAALDLTRTGIVAISAAGRLWAAGFYTYYVLKLGAPSTFLIFTVLDAVMALLHIWALGPDRWERVKAAFAYRELS